jgi:hypothetical protein
MSASLACASLSVRAVRGTVKRVDGWSSSAGHLQWLGGGEGIIEGPGRQRAGHLRAHTMSHTHTIMPHTQHDFDDGRSG